MRGKVLMLVKNSLDQTTIEIRDKKKWQTPEIEIMEISLNTAGGSFGERDFRGMLPLG